MAVRKRVWEEFIWDNEWLRVESSCAPLDRDAEHLERAKLILPPGMRIRSLLAFAYSRVTTARNAIAAELSKRVAAESPKNVETARVDSGA